MHVKSSCGVPWNIAAELKGQSYEKVCEIEIWNVSFGLNLGSPTVFKIVKSPL
jgi:hypothetical protein